MRKIVKLRESEILTSGLSYAKNRDKPAIRKILLEEQKGLCAYSEDQMASPTYAKDIEHFNPILKESADDGYENWYLASSVWNKKKGTRYADSRWLKYQPVLSPSSFDIEDRLKYDINSGAIVATNADDEAANNTIKYLLLDDPDLSKDRKNYLFTLKEFLQDYNLDINQLKKYLKKNPLRIKYVTAIKAEFNFDPMDL